MTDVSLLYNCAILVVDLLAVWWFRRRRSLSVWFAAMMAANACSFGLAGVLAWRYENHFGFFRLWAYGVFLHDALLLAATAFLWRRVRPRLAVASLTAMAALLLIAADAFLIEPHGLEVSHYEIASPKIHAPLRIVVLADLQTRSIGPYERSVFQRALDEKPDIILLAGDYFQAPFKQRPALLAELNACLRDLHFSAPLGVYAVSGNIDSHLWRKSFEEAGIIAVPSTRSFDVGGIRLTCLGLYNAFNSRLKLPNPEPDRFHLVLGHTPNFALGDVSADLMVAGHTHGGQVRLPLVGPLITHSLIPIAWAAGLTDLPDGRRLLVSRGVGMERGFAPPMRFLCRPELVVIDIVPEHRKGEAADETVF